MAKAYCSSCGEHPQARNKYGFCAYCAKAQSDGTKFDKLVKSLGCFVSGDDVSLDRKTFLLYVVDRIKADLESF